MSEKFESFEPVAEKKEGYDVSATVYLMRHPHKDSYEGDVSNQGIEDTEKLKLLFDRYQKIYKTDDLEVSHSGHKRPLKAAQILSGLPADNNEESKNGVRESLAFIGSEKLEEKYKEIVDKNNGDESEAAQMLIDTGDKRFDEESLSSVEISQRIAQELLDIVEQTKTYKSGTKKPIILISHSGVVENFLVDLLKKRPEEHSLEAIGGRLDFLEDMRLYINRCSPEEVSLRYRFRDWQGELSEADLRKLAGTP
jgi:broad specificity phosphatase PhoE